MHACVQVAEAIHCLNEEDDKIQFLRSVAVSGNGAYIATAHAGYCNAHVDGIFLWHADTGQQICMIEESDSCFKCMDLNHEGTFLATGSSYGEYERKCVMLWKIENGKASNSAYAVMQLDCEAWAVKFSRDSQRLASVRLDGGVEIWSVQSIAWLLTFDGHMPEHDLSDDESQEAICGDPIVLGLAWSSDSRVIATGGTGKTIQVWDSTTGELVMEPLMGHNNTVDCVDFVRDTNLLVSGSYRGTIIVWQLWQGKGARVMHRLETVPVGGIFISADSRFFVSCSRETVGVWDIASGQEVMTISTGNSSQHVYFTPIATFSPDGLFIVDGTQDSAYILKVAVQVNFVNPCVHRWV
jgi:WD40 repeat protein